MKSIKLIKFVKKILPFIVVFCVLSTYAINYKLKSSNTYVASEVIHYNDAQTEQGLTPIGTKLDVNEIRSSAVMSKVVDRMGLTGIYSVDSLISRVSITPIPDGDKLAQKEAKLKEGEEYVYEPNTYIVSFVATNSEGSDFARHILDEILDVYFAQYSQKYVNVAPAKNLIADIENSDYDYIEIVELIDSGIDETLSTLYQRMEQNPYYRSTKTGTSFSDLADEFNYLRQVTLSGLFSTIYKYQITKNKVVLLSDYKTRIDNNNILKDTEKSIVDDTVDVIDAYVEKMRESGNTNISYEYILDGVHEIGLNNGASGDQTVTYDELIYSWREHNETNEHLVIDTAYCRYVINTFQKCIVECKDCEKCEDRSDCKECDLCEECKCAYSLQTCMQMNYSDYLLKENNVRAEIKSLIADLGVLYNITMETNDEYNEYLGASYISVLSSSSVKPSINVKLYTIIAFFFLIVLCGGGAIVLGRVVDIVNYIFYVDHHTELSNRAYFDKYLKSMDKKLLDDGTVYCVVDIANLISINAEYSRQAGDDIIKMFTVYLKETFGKTNAELIYNGNGSFVILANGVDYITVEDIVRLFGLRLDDREEHREIKIEYKVGIAETFKENQTARRLLAKAIKSKKDYVSKADNNSESK